MGRDCFFKSDNIWYDIRKIVVGGSLMGNVVGLM